MGRNLTISKETWPSSFTAGNCCEIFQGKVLPQSPAPELGQKKKKVRNAWKAPNWLCYDYEDEILTFVSTCHKKLEMLKLHKGFLRIKNPVARNCELSDWKINIRRRNYFQIGVFLITKSFWRGITNRCVVNKISHQHVLFFFHIFIAVIEIQLRIGSKTQTLLHVFLKLKT